MALDVADPPGEKPRMDRRHDAEAAWASAPAPCAASGRRHGLSPTLEGGSSKLSLTRSCRQVATCRTYVRSPPPRHRAVRRREEPVQASTDQPGHANRRRVGSGTRKKRDTSAMARPHCLPPSTCSRRVNVYRRNMQPHPIRSSSAYQRHRAEVPAGRCPLFLDNYAPHKAPEGALHAL